MATLNLENFRTLKKSSTWQYLLHSYPTSNPSEPCNQLPCDSSLEDAAGTHEERDQLELRDHSQALSVPEAVSKGHSVSPSRPPSGSATGSLHTHHAACTAIRAQCSANSPNAAPTVQ